MQTVHVHGQLELERFLSEEELAEALLAVRLCIIQLFAGTDSPRGRRATPGYIVGCDRQLRTVAHFVLGRIEELRQQIFSADDLPDDYRLYVNDSPDNAARQVVFELIKRQLADMKNRQQLYYLPGNGEWWMLQTVLDEYLVLARTVQHNAGRRDRRRRTRYRKNALPPWLMSHRTKPALVS